MSTPRRPDPTDGLDRHERIALLDLSRGLAGLFGDGDERGWRRQTGAHFTHPPGVVAQLVARGLVETIAPGVAQVTRRGRLQADKLRRRRQAIERMRAGETMRERAGTMGRAS